jgi:hypothetical protein
VIVKGRGEIRFERRWSDYLEVCERGTPEAVGLTEPRLPDLRQDVIDVFASDTGGGWQAADLLLDKVWEADSLHWPQRLLRFLSPLPQRAQTAFAALVKAGYQPDQLAFQFCEAAKAEEYAADEERLIPELDALDKLGAQAVAAVTALTNRRRQFDEYLIARRLRVIEGEPGSAALKILQMDLEDMVAEQNADSRQLRRQLDRRRETLLGHAEVRLSRRVHEVTGEYHDKEVEEILEELRANLGQPVRAPGALKKRRKRWREQFHPDTPTDAE